MPSKSTRSAKGMGNIRLRPDNTYEGRITINGKRKSFYGAKQGDAKAMRAAKKAADDGTYFEPVHMSVAKWLDIWLNEYVLPSVKPLTFAAYQSQSEHHIKPALGKIKLNALNATNFRNSITIFRKLIIFPKNN